MTATGGGGAGTVYDGSLNSIPYYPTAGTAITGSLSFTNTGTSINIGYTTAATNSSSGALTVVGGVGIGDSLFVAGNISFNTGTNGYIVSQISIWKLWCNLFYKCYTKCYKLHYDY